MFGCDVYEVIPNDQFKKYPGSPRGRKIIFVGFDENRAGFKLFDPYTRTYHSAGDCYFYENSVSAWTLYVIMISAVR